MSKANIYNEDYFENGTVCGISGYFNYHWMPEMTLRMVHHMIQTLAILESDIVLDFGCAKGYIVKAFRIMDIQTFGVDISEYAINHADGEVKQYCTLLNGVDDNKLFIRNYDWMIAKDVFEHIEIFDLQHILNQAAKKVKNIFAVIPLAEDDLSNKYIIPDYHNDITHIVAKSKDWWIKLFNNSSYELSAYTSKFIGCKENWTKKFPNGNGFFILKSKIL